MAPIISLIVAAAAKVGAPVVKSILEKHVGGIPGSLAGAVIDQVAEHAGVEPDQLATAEPAVIEAAVKEVEAAGPEVIALYRAGLEAQFKLLETENAEGFWQSAWRWGWMYLLAILWVCAFVLFPALKIFEVRIDPIDTATLMTLTGWFISLYMGGHTVKEIGRQAVEAVKTWRGSNVQ
ncbi:hypothetical protein [Gellertiella hungarica]|uniref:Holin of 3TMs, for gene-transfer release n=1 Tax=Gellertiella hungarica TaxID=1572859 RepID=A0A7W6J7J8_9HYPH|nr:hypothetical protein [Gellertiella hungarica]MBB4066259.1 hypothetical protein [Gellertiella hungarica]